MSNFQNPNIQRSTNTAPSVKSAESAKSSPSTKSTLHAPPKIPRIAWFVTSRCDSNCKFCWRPLVEEELGTWKSKKLIKRIAKAGVSTLVFSGGEPTLRGDLCYLIAYANRLGLGTVLSTNSHFLPKLLLKLKRLKSSEGKIDCVEIPIDYADPSIDVRGKKHIQYALMALGMLRRRGSKIEINTLITQLNKNQLLDIGEIISDYPIGLWKIRKFLPRYAAMKYKEMFQITDQEFGKVANDVSEKFPDISKSFVGEKNYSPSYLLIKPNGVLFMHHGTEEKIFGNILRVNLRRVWEDLSNTDKEHYYEII